MLFIKSILCLRHAKTNVDEDQEKRVVIEEGFQQIAQRKMALQEEGYLNDIAYGFYGYPRHLQTLQGILTERPLNLIEIPELKMPQHVTDQSDCSTIFKKLPPPANLNTWLVQDRNLFLARYGMNAASAIIARSERAKHIMVVGSYNLINVVGVEFALMRALWGGHTNHKVVDALCENSLKECDGFRLDFTGQKPTCKIFVGGTTIIVE